MTVWVYEPTPCICQLYTPGAQVLQPEHTVLCHSQKQVRSKEKQIVKKNYLKGNLVYMNVLFPDKIIYQSYKRNIKETTIKLHVYDWYVF